MLRNTFWPPKTVKVCKKSTYVDVNILKLKFNHIVIAFFLIQCVKYPANPTKCQFYNLWTTLYADKIVRSKMSFTDKKAVYNYTTVHYLVVSVLVLLNVI